MGVRSPHVEAMAVMSAYELMAEALPGKGVDQNIGVLDVGATSTRFYVFRNEEQIFMRESPFGGNQLTQEIQRAYNMTGEEAESAKRSGNLPANYDNDVLRPYVDTLRDIAPDVMDADLQVNVMMTIAGTSRDSSGSITRSVIPITRRAPCGNGPPSPA